MIKKSILSILAATAILTMSGCGAEDAVKKAVESAGGSVVDNLSDISAIDGSASHKATNLGDRSFEISFDITQGTKVYNYSISNSETNAVTSWISSDGYFNTGFSDTLTCVPKNEESFDCTTELGVSTTLTPNPELYLHKTTSEMDGNSVDTKHNYKMETITVNGLVAK